MGITQEQLEGIKRADRADGLEILRIVLELTRKEEPVVSEPEEDSSVPKDEGGWMVVNQRDLPTELQELVGEMEREYQKPVVCRIVSK